MDDFLLPIVFISVSELLITFCSNLGGKGRGVGGEKGGGGGEEEEGEKKVSPQEKVWSIGFYSNLFLTHNDW